MTCSHYGIQIVRSWYWCTGLDEGIQNDNYKRRRVVNGMVD